MGAGVSAWPLAKAVSQAGQLGVVAGTALDELLARRLQLGDPGGHMRRALAAFPVPALAQSILDRYFVRDGKPAGAPFMRLPKLDVQCSKAREELTVAGCFAEVFLAKEGHDGPIGINLLEKIQAPTLPSLFGAMLAGVNVVLMGAGIPRSIPGVLDRLSAAQPAQLAIDVAGAAPGDQYLSRFHPEGVFPDGAPEMQRPLFFPIVSSATVASVLVRKANGRVDGLVVEGTAAGGHNAPPRGPLRTNDAGEPIFGERDEPSLRAIARLGIPFWVAGGCASPMGLKAAQAEGARGIQVGTAFAFCKESGITADLKRRTLEMVEDGRAQVLTDAKASPTGYPFKVLQMEGTLSDAKVSEARTRVCDLGYLREAYARSGGRVGWRCPGEPQDIYLAKGGEMEQTQGRKCVCNGLLANIGLAQELGDGHHEPALLTAGTDLSVVARMIEAHGQNYRAAHVIQHVLDTPSGS